jgi:hypothetical protein
MKSGKRPPPGGLFAALLLWRGDWTRLYVVPPGLLLCFITAGMNASVLLIEINRKTRAVRPPGAPEAIHHRVSGAPRLYRPREGTPVEG